MSIHRVAQNHNMQVLRISHTTLSFLEEIASESQQLALSRDLHSCLSCPAQISLPVRNDNKLDNREVELYMWDSQNLLTVVLCAPVYVFIVYFVDNWNPIWHRFYWPIMPQNWSRTMQPTPSTGHSSSTSHSMPLTLHYRPALPRNIMNNFSLPEKWLRQNSWKVDG